MSDELPPPPLRLKPRPKLGEESATPAPNPSPAPERASAAPDESAPPRLKLRPKLDLADEAIKTPANPPAPPETAVPPTPAISLKPRLSIAQPTPQAEPTQVPPAQPPSSELTAGSVATPPPHEPPKFKLKEKAPSAVGDAPPAVASGRNALPPPGNALPPPVLRVAAPAPEATAPVTPKPGAPLPVDAGTPSVQPSAAPPPLLTKRAVQVETEEAETADPGQSSLAKIILLVAAVVLVGGVYFGYKKLTESSVDEAEAPTANQAPARPSSPSKTLNEIGAIPAQAIKKAEDVVAAVRANEEAPVEEILANEIPIPPRPRKAAPNPVETSVAPVTSTTELAPGLRATTVAAVEGDAAPAFRAWVAQVRISGVFQGTPARVLINGKTVPAGQVVDEALGIVFDGVDPETKTLVFRDSTGATVARKF